MLAWPKGKPPVVKFVQELPGEQEFAMVATVDVSTIALFHCLECDFVSKFRWDRTKRRFVSLRATSDE